MKQSISALLGELAGYEDSLERARGKKRNLNRDEHVLEGARERAREELYDRIWQGESTGNVLDDIVIATKGAPDSHAVEQFRSFMERFQLHRGQFVAGRGVAHDFNLVLVGVVDSGIPIFCHKKAHIILPISPAVSFNASWPYGYQHLNYTRWSITINKDDCRERRRCYDLESLWDSKADIHIGDEAAWKFVYDRAKNPLSPMLTFIHAASAVGRPIMTIPALKGHVGPLVEGLEENMSRLYNARKKLAQIIEDVVVCPGIFSGPVGVDVEKARETATENLKEAVLCIRYASRPHQLKDKKK